MFCSLTRKGYKMILLVDIETIPELEANFSEIEKENPREAAEVAFVIATHYHRKGNDKTKIFAQKSIDLFLQCKVETYEQCCALHSSICGICLPDLIHEGVVRARFADFQLSAS